MARAVLFVGLGACSSSASVAEDPDASTAGETGGDVGTGDGGTDTAADVVPAADGACPAGLVNCGGVCRDVSIDNGACGGCGRTCNAAQKCVSGVCTCTGTSCGGSCVDTSKDPRNCGGCGKACTGAAPACVGGTCACPATAKTCGTRCTDVANDPENCGDCGKACGAAEVCVGGACACRPGTTLCGTTCVDTTASATNCGACGKACATGEVCIAGACKTGGCSGGLTLCSGACVNTRTNPAFCGTGGGGGGACGRACAADELCIDGRCEGYTPAPFCTTCPCSCGGRRCCPALPGGTAALCVDADACPGG
ncbi:MAG: hypothetical protein JNL79_23305 [Myxococcales bacterium]|nr:hypothetical protein [Myxococcales bacterium]